MLARAAAGATALVAAVAIAATAASAATPRQVGSFSYTTKKPGAATGLITKFDFQNPENPSQKPHAVAKMVIKTPPGSGIDTTVRPRCHATDAQLQLLGPSQCPSNTRVGGGFVISDTGGGGGPTPRFTRTTINNFNGDGEVIGVGVNDDTPAIKSVDHTKFSANTSTTVFPIFPGFPPPDPFTPIKSLHETFPRFAANGHPYARTPPTCPSSRRWTIRATFTYQDGVVQTLTSHSPCTRPKKRRKPRGHTNVQRCGGARDCSNRNRG